MGTYLVVFIQWVYVCYSALIAKKVRSRKKAYKLGNDGSPGRFSEGVFCQFWTIERAARGCIPRCPLYFAPEEIHHLVRLG